MRSRGSLIFLLTASILLDASGCKRPPPASGVNPAESLHAQVRGAHPELRAHERLEDYQDSPFHPTQIVERIHALESATAWDELCKELIQLPDDELELFEDEIAKPEHARRMPCAQQLLRRLELYWREAERRLREAHPAGVAVPRLASVTVPVDVSRSDIFTDGKLPDDEIAITFDDGPHPTRTPRVLQILQAAGIRATFFEIGRNASAHPDVARQVLAAGNVIGSHTFSHANLLKVGEAHAETEIESGDSSVSLALGLQPAELPFFRFPYGARTPTAQGFVQKQGKTTFFWNMDSQDWQIRDPHKLFLNVLQQLDRHKHGIILFHDIHEQTVIVLPHVLQELSQHDMKTAVFVPVASH